MSVLPDELWRRIMEIGVENKALDYKGLCCLSISCRLLRGLSAEDSLWSALLIFDFPSTQIDDTKIQSSSSSISEGKLKSLYKIRYEKDRDQKLLSHRRVVLRIESEIAVRVRRIQEIKLQSSVEKHKMNKAVAELLNLRKVRQSSASLNVWQPEIIRDSHKQMVQQCTVPVDNRINALEMELSLCRQQIAGFEKTTRVEKRRLTEAKERLDSVKYHPLRGVSGSSFLDEPRTKSKMSKNSSCNAQLRLYSSPVP